MTHTKLCFGIHLSVCVCVCVFMCVYLLPHAPKKWHVV